MVRIEPSLWVFGPVTTIGRYIHVALKLIENGRCTCYCKENDLQGSS